MSAVFWIVIGIVLLAALSGVKKPAAPKEPYRIDRLHVIDPEDYECSACRRRFQKNQMICPYCGARFTERVKDGEEYDFEEDELAAWDAEDGL